VMIKSPIGKEVAHDDSFEGDFDPLSTLVKLFMLLFCLLLKLTLHRTPSGYQCARVYNVKK
jgi:hypothetical protein